MPETVSHLSVNFNHYEHQGINLRLTHVVGGGVLVEVEREDTKTVLMKINLPANTKLQDRRGT